MAAAAETVRSGIEALHPSGKIETKKWDIDPLAPVDIPPIVQKMGKMVRDWLNPAKSWELKGIRTAISDPKDSLKQSLDDYLKNGPSDNSPDKVYFAFHFMSPNARKTGVLSRQVDTWSAIDREKTYLVSETKNSNEFEVEILNGTGLLPQNQALETRMHIFYVDSAIVTTNEVLYIDFGELNKIPFGFPTSKTPDSLYVVLNLGDLYHLLRDRQTEAEKQLGYANQDRKDFEERLPTFTERFKK